MTGLITGEIRYMLVNHAFEDYKRIVSNGLTARQAREDIERDYELTEREKHTLREMILDELEARMENK